jgi:hypothetical protein
MLWYTCGDREVRRPITFNSLGHLFAGTDTDQEEEMVKIVLEESNDPWLTDSKPRTSATAYTTPDNGTLALHRRLANSSRL